MQHVKCWMNCDNDAAKELWYEDNGIKHRKVCLKCYKLLRRVLHYSGTTEDEVKAKVLTSHLLYHSDPHE